MYARAVWKEGEIEEEGVVPENWIDEKQNIVRWPRMSTTKTEKAIKEKQNPQDDWMTFPLIKIKMKSGKYRYCFNENKMTCMSKSKYTFECFQMFNCLTSSCPQRMRKL